MKLLVADDSQMFRTMLQRMLEGWGYEVVLARDGNEARAILESENAPPIAILDCVMPGPSGFELCELIRSVKQGSVYTILMSADDEQEHVLKGFELGADDYLCKPFKQLELRTRLLVGELSVRSRASLSEVGEVQKFESPHDALLRTWNRRAILELLGKELHRAKRFRASLSILVVDMDLFKNINNEFGHEVGDVVLCSAFDRIAGSVRESDYVGRLDDDEFIVVLFDCPAEGARIVAQRILREISETPAANVVKVTASIGLAQWSEGQAISELLHRAHSALHRAKQNGRDRVEVEDAISYPPCKEILHLHPVPSRRALAAGMTMADMAQSAAKV
jgi:diguanylate cyclase (GGDEF)-like protein